MRRRWAPCVAFGAVSLVAVACGIDALGTAELDAGPAGGDAASGSDGGGAGGDSSSTSEGGSGDGSVGIEGGGPCALADGDAGTTCGSACVDFANDRANCGGCGTKCSAWAACEGKCVDVAANLVGIRHAIPCTSDASPACANGANPVDEKVTLTGTTGRKYTISARFRGVLEQRTYTGDTNGIATGENATFWTTGGTSGGGDTWNIYDLAVSAPAATWHLNSGETGHTYCDRIDYVASFEAMAGATITVHADSIDTAQARNRSAGDAFILVPDIAPYPAPFYGQFVQIDVVSVR